MAAHREVRRALLEKLGGISRQALGQRIQRLQRKLPMTSEDALYMLAHQHGVDIGRHLDVETLSRVSNYVTQLNGTPGPPRTGVRRAATPRQVVVEVAGVNVGALPGLTATHAHEARVMAEKIYPILYVFENSARDVISRVLKARIGPDWWTKVVPDDIQKEAARRMKNEGKEAWHSKRSGHPIQYVDLPHLAQIVRARDAWAHFAPLFPRETWLDSVIDDLNVSRRVVAHMNPLSSDDIKSVENGFRKWVKQLQAKSSELP